MGVSVSAKQLKGCAQSIIYSPWVCLLPKLLLLLICLAHFPFVLHFLTSLTKFILQTRGRWRTWWGRWGLSLEGPIASCSVILPHSESGPTMLSVPGVTLSDAAQLSRCPVPSSAVGLCILWDVGAPCSLHVGMWESKWSLLGPWDPTSHLLSPCPHSGCVESHEVTASRIPGRKQTQVPSVFRPQI